MIKGTISVTWSEKDYKDLSYSPQTVKQHQASIKVINEKITDHNGIYMCNKNLPDVFEQAGKIFNLQKTVCVINRMDPGQYLPFHTDNYPTYIKRNNIQDTSKLTRIIVFLHDQKPGHQLWIEDDICMGPAGSYFGWHFNTKHMAANLGYESRYILQITGVSQDE